MHKERRKKECRDWVEGRESEVLMRRVYTWESKKIRCERECCKLLPVGMMCIVDCAR